LKASGSGLKYYTLPIGLKEMRRIVFDIMMTYNNNKKEFEQIFEDEMWVNYPPSREFFKKK
jgi:hypothetical protein